MDEWNLRELLGYGATEQRGDSQVEGLSEAGGAQAEQEAQAWKPGGQNMADFIDFEYNSINYLIGLGTYDASVWIIKLDGAGDVTGYAYSRVVVDYTASTSSKRTMGGFGAGYRYGAALCMA